MPANRRVAVIDDSAEIRELIQQILHEEGPYEVHEFEGGEATIAELRRSDPGVLMLDLRLAEADRGWQLLCELRADPALAALPLIVCTADAGQLRERGDDLARMPGVFVLEKPFELEALESLVACAMEATAVRE